MTIIAIDIKQLAISKIVNFSVFCISSNDKIIFLKSGKQSRHINQENIKMVYVSLKIMTFSSIYRI